MFTPVYLSEPSKGGIGVDTPFPVPMSKTWLIPLITIAKDGTTPAPAPRGNSISLGHQMGDIHSLVIPDDAYEIPSFFLLINSTYRSSGSVALQVAISAFSVGKSTFSIGKLTPSIDNHRHPP